MANIAGTVGEQALVISCPVDDLDALVAVLVQNPVALLPVGGVGELGGAAGVRTVLLVEIGPEGASPTIRWRASVADATPVDDAGALLPASWVARHPDAYAASRRAASVSPDEVDRLDGDGEEEREEGRRQVFLPLTSLEQLPKEHWLFANELVSKQHREGRTFAPRVPALVTLPDD